MRRIAIEEAFVTEAISDEWRSVILGGAPREPGFAKLGGLLMGDSDGARLVHSMLSDLDTGRIAHMDATGIDVQVVSITSPGVQVPSPQRRSDRLRGSSR